MRGPGRQRDLRRGHHPDRRRSPASRTSAPPRSTSRRRATTSSRRCPPGSSAARDPSYCEFDGTSMAAPMVSGAAVDILAAYSGAERQRRSRRRSSPASIHSASLTGKVGHERTARRVQGDAELRRPPRDRADGPDRRAGPGRRRHRHDHLGRARLERRLRRSLTGYDVEGPNGTTHVATTTMSANLSGLADNATTLRRRARGRVRGPGTVGHGADPAVRRRLRGRRARCAPSAWASEARHPSAATGPAFPADLARGVAILPTGTGGYVVDAYGGLHRSRSGRQPHAARDHGRPVLARVGHRARRRVVAPRRRLRRSTATAGSTRSVSARRRRRRPRRTARTGTGSTSPGGSRSRRTAGAATWSTGTAASTRSRVSGGTLPAYDRRPVLAGLEHRARDRPRARVRRRLGPRRLRRPASLREPPAQRPGRPSTSPYWPGWDIARGLDL